MLNTFIKVVPYESSEVDNYNYSDIKVVNPKLLKESKKLDQTKFFKIDLKFMIIIMKMVKSVQLI